MSIRAKLVGGFLSVAVLLLLVGAGGYFGVGRMDRAMEGLQQTGPLIDAVEAMKTAVDEDLRTVMVLLTAPDQDRLDGAWGQHTSQTERFAVYSDAVLNGGETEIGTIAPTRDDSLRAALTQTSEYHSTQLQPLIQQIYDLGKEGFSLSSQREAVGAETPEGERIYAQYLSVEEEKFNLEFSSEEVAQEMTTLLDQVVVSADLAAEDAATSSMGVATIVRRGIVGGVLAGFILALVIGYLVAMNISKPLLKITEIARYVADGNLAAEIDIEREDEIGELATAFGQTIGSIGGMTRELNGLTAAASAGDLDHRGNPEGLGGAYGELVHQANQLVDSVAAPVRRASEYMEKVSEGEIPPPIEEEYSGEFGRIKVSLNRVIQVMGQLVDETGTLTAAAQAGELDTRGDAGVFTGSWKELVEGINAMMDAFVTPTQAAFGVLNAAAQGDMTARMEGDWSGAYGEIKRNVNGLIEMMDQGMGQVSVAANQVAGAAEQIASGSQALAQGTSEQASTLEEVASSLEEMSSMSEQSSANAREAKGLSDGARQRTDKGVDSMLRLSEAMDRIKTSSDETAKIVRTIDEIAFQTNLLALNAAVEAARAGDAGKGFAVVAEEVRNLAMRSAEAAKTTAQLIDESVSNSEGGVVLNQEVTEHLEEIAKQVVQVSEVMDEVAAAAEQQKDGIDQLNVAVEQMNQVTQQTAANAEESSSASEELTGQAGEMRSLVARYRLSQGSDESGRAHRRAEPGRAPGAGAPPPAQAPRKGNGHTPAEELIPFDEDGGDDLTLSEF